MAIGEVTEELVAAVHEHHAYKILQGPGREPTTSRAGGAILSKRTFALSAGGDPPTKGVQRQLTLAKLREKAKGMDEIMLAE